MLTCTHGIKPLKNCSICYKEAELNKVRNYRKKCKQKNLVLIGDKCLVCGTELSICYHEKHGKRHNENTQPFYYLKNPDKFIPLCYKHHKIVHELAEIDNLSLIKILALVDIIR
jgi:hypothetical protein